MTEYLYFWKSPQKIIFDLGNLIGTYFFIPALEIAKLDILLLDIQMRSWRG